MDLFEEIESHEGAITIEWLAARLNVSPKTLYKLAHRGTLPSFKIGTCVRMNPKTVADWLRQRHSVVPPGRTRPLREFRP